VSPAAIEPAGWPGCQSLDETLDRPSEERTPSALKIIHVARYGRARPRRTFAHIGDRLHERQACRRQAGGGEGRVQNKLH
jgi:hypothetical protein